MKDDIFSAEHKKPKEEQQGTEDKEKEEEEDVECVDTKIWMWEGDQYDEFDSEYLNQIFPYKLSKKTMAKGSQFIFHFLSSSLHFWVELVHHDQPEVDKLSKKDIKVMSQILQTEQCDNWIAYRRWGQNLNKQQQFLAYQQQQPNFIEPKGEQIHSYTRGEDSFSIVKYTGDDKGFNDFKQRIEVLLLFYIDGVSFIFEQVDTWVYYIVYKKVKGSQRKLFVGMLSKYVFRLSTVKQRHRISQVFILPTYQKSGHGKQLIDVVYDISLKDDKCFEITTQIPSFEYQCLRDYKQIEMIVQSSILDLKQMKTMKTKADIDENKTLLLTKESVRKLKLGVKIPGHQIERLVNLLVYWKVLQQNDDMVRAYFDEDLREKIISNRSVFKTRRKLPHLTLFGKVPNLKDFMVEKAKEDIVRNQEEILEILLQTINGFNRVIAKAVKNELLQ